jgi:hypothetical protein
VEVEVRCHDHRDRLGRPHVRLDRRCRGRELEPRQHRVAEPSEQESQLVGAGPAAVAVAVAVVYSARQ